MTRALAVALAAMLAGIAGCGPGFAAGEGRFDDVASQELPIRVRITGAQGDWASVEILADVTAPGARWATLTGGETLSGPARRTTDGAAQLEWGPEWIQPATCTDSVCEIDLVLSLDAAPTEPWDATVTASVWGDAASVEIVERP